MLKIGLLAVLALLLAPAVASAASTIKVTSQADEPLAGGASECETAENVCTLRAAVELADQHAGEETKIEAPEGAYEQSHGTLSVLDEAKITIVGAAAADPLTETAKTVVEGEGHTVFLVGEDSSLVLEGVAVTRGEADAGGGIAVAEEGSLLLKRSTVFDNSAGVGGGIVGEEGTITIEDSLIAANDAYAGGAVFATAGTSVTVEGSAVRENRGEYGAGILADGATVTVKGSTLVKNESDGSGGGVYAAFDEESSRGASVTIEGSAIVEDGATVAGGGVYGESQSEVTISKKSEVIDDYADLAGGGAFAEAGSKLTVEGSTFSDDYADLAGGGAFAETGSKLTVEGSTFSDDEAELGGAIYTGELNEDCEADARGAARRGARSAGATRDAAAGQPAEGVLITRSTLDENYAEVGGGVYVGVSRYECEDAARAQWGHGAAHDRAGAHARPAGAHARAALDEAGKAASLTIEQSTLAYNEAIGRVALGGAVYTEQLGDEDALAHIVDSTIAENAADTTDSDGGFADGGGLAVAEGSVAELVSDTVYANATGVSESEDVGRSAAHRDATVSQAGPGNNLAAEEGDDDFEGGFIGLRDTIVSEPSASSENCEGPVGSLVAKAGYNLDYPSNSVVESSFDTCGMSEEEHDLVGVNPDLANAGLVGNGGPTQTIALEAASPAIGYVPLAGDCEDELIGPALPDELGEVKPVDQRGEPRPGIHGKGCDVGAYEYQQPEEPKKEEPKPVATTPAGPAPTPAPATKTEPAPAPKAEVLSVKVVSPVACTSKRDIVIHIQNVKRYGIVSAVVSIDGKHRRTLTGKHLTTGIDLRGLPKGTFTVEIVARTSSGRTLRGQRVYHTCHTKLPGHSYLNL